MRSARHQRQATIGHLHRISIDTAHDSANVVAISAAGSQEDGRKGGISLVVSLRSSSAQDWSIAELAMSHLSGCADSAYLSSSERKKARQFGGAIHAIRRGMEQLDIDALSEQVIGAAMTVHSALGAGLLESIYRDCLAIELRLVKIPFELEVRLPIIYRGTRVRDPLRIDMRVDGRLIVEVKAVERLHPVFRAQVITYLKLSDSPAGLLLNFNSVSLRHGLHRLDHPDVYAKKQAEKKNRREARGQT